MKAWLAVIFLALATLSVAVVQADTPPSPVPAAAAATSSSERFDVNAATQAYMNELTPVQRARSNSYFQGGYWLLLWDLLWVLGVSWLLLGTRLSARMRNAAQRITRWRWLQTALYGMQYIVLTSVIMLPWSLYEGYFREHQYGLSNLSLGQWFGEQGKGLLVGLIMGTLALVVIYAVIRRAPRTWWIWGAGVAIVFSMVVATIAPVYLAPLFNTYKPLPENALKEQILSMARANGIPAKNVYWFDASKQSKRISANVSGMFGTTRISLNDNLLHRSSPSEIKAVLGHEMGHYVLNHVYKGIVFFGVIMVLGFAFVYFGFARVARRWGRRCEVRGAGDVAGLPLLVALFTVFMFFMTPLTNTITRSMEAEADAFGLNAARQPDGFAQAAVQLSEYRKMHPGPVEEFVFFDHPSGWNRIHRSMVWKAEHLDDAEVRQQNAVAPPGAR